MKSSQSSPSSRARRPSSTQSGARRGSPAALAGAVAAIGALCLAGVYLDSRHAGAPALASLAPAAPAPTKRPDPAPSSVASASPAPAVLAAAGATPPARDPIADTLAGRASPAPAPKPAKLSSTAWRDLDAALVRAIDGCWGKPAGTTGFAPKIRVDFNRDGGLATRPVLLNPPADPAANRAAQGAANALGRCKDLAVPARFADFYDQWRTRVIHLGGA